MRKALLMSILFMTFLIPIWLAREKNVRRGAQRTVIYTVIFIALWTYYQARVFWSLPAPPKLRIGASSTAPVAGGRVCDA